ncbi:hypothetical protein HIM_07928 [Hirsutella minnesotensis 3608]|uniref:Septation initiation network scaffold protein cdc11 n=1 Tax=Hirsutella minnesotensis 3608 TaxID=1043627 RepID=A0A0F7ZHJ2_9HYPO|nr:hypothetical protein HIM_07928 [Hirsutella minnesotensis 3608]
MHHAWLDSLSEDWVSQPESDASPDKLPSNTTSSPAPRRDYRSRIPRRTPNSKSSPLSNPPSSPFVLNERSSNDVNISSTGRSPSMLAAGFKASMSDRGSQSAGSVVRNSIRVQSSSRRQSETPEWKRRLVHGRVPYGEQRDLFSSAAAGLQDIFKPPQSGQDLNDQSRATMPSSPPVAVDLGIDADLERFVASVDENESTGQPAFSPSPSPRRSQREIKYTLNVSESPSESRQPGVEDALTVDARRQNGPSPALNHLRAPSQAKAGAARKASGQSDIRNEDLSPILIGKHSDCDGKIGFAPIEVPVEQLKQKLERLRMNQMVMDSLVDLQAEDGAANAETTDFYLRNGAFINLQRGGRSGDGSFYNRGLSSEIGADSSEMLPEESLQASTPKQFPTVRSHESVPRPSIRSPPSPSLPRAPFPSPDKRQMDPGSPDRPPPSPLKLFGPYDTFTNQTLLRRISQFEETSPSLSRVSLASSGQEPEYGHNGSPVERLRAISRFGGGDLDGYEFSGDLYSDSEEGAEARDKENISPVPNLAIRMSFAPPRDASPDHDPHLIVRRRRNQSSDTRTAVSSPPFERREPPAALGHWGLAPTMTPKRDGESDGKRPRTSPSKDPTPKRRRTLHRSDVAFGHEHQFAAVDSAHRQMQAIMGERRNDGQLGYRNPASPTASPLRSNYWSRAVDDCFDSSQPDTLVESICSGRDHTILSPTDDDSRTRRQPSIRTQDFVDQAAQIMAMIRSQVRPGLASLEESEAENEGTSPHPSLTDSGQESTNEPLSRPPSRDGKPLPRVPHRQEDPELMRRLMQYQEQSDNGHPITSSLRSAEIAGNKAPDSLDMEEANHQSSSLVPERSLHVYDNIISDLPNVRITPSHHHRNGSAGTNRDFPTLSSGRLTSRTFPTTSSRGSESRRTIMPQSVSHLIPDRVGGMYLDKQQNIWIKRKDSRASPPSDVLPSDDSEDDPFASIPDLSVDMTKELQNLRLTSSQKEDAITKAELSNSHPSCLPDDNLKEQSGQAGSPVSPKEDLFVKRTTRAQAQLEKPDNFISISQVDSPGDPGRDGSSKRRNLTISFSSPIASIIHDVVAEDLDSLEDDPVQLPTTHGHQLSSRSNMGGATRPLSSRGPCFTPRPISRIDEQDEESTVEIQADDDRQISIIGQNSILSRKTLGGRHASLSFIINHTPNNGTMSIHPDESAIIGRNVGKLSLSPLSDFTMDNSDQSFGFEVSYVVGRRHLATGDGSRKVMSMTMRELVGKLGEVEPYEPFWEDLDTLNLHDKHLSSLHMLDEFCGRLVTLDASNNRLGHLDGVPPTVRQLKVSRNLLTELTSWDHLMNLQYVDVSGNEVRSLSALKNLVHLRSIKADSCQLTNLDGFNGHDGLLSLRARDNAIESLDFSTIALDRLAELDLNGNQIISIRKLEKLPALSQLQLRGNKLVQFTANERLDALRQLDLSDNEIEILDFSNLPNIRIVQVDRNRVFQLSGLERARRLDSLSLREQRGDRLLDLGFLRKAYEIRKLYLSGNYLEFFQPTVDFLNLQLLDLANCGLQRLPDRMGQQMPNLRTLNLNFNAIADLSPLLFVPRLKKLLAAGNRLADSTALTQLLTEFPHLTQLDTRNNPVTLGLYASVQVLMPLNQSSFVDPFTLPDADAERDALFASRLDLPTRLRRRLHHVVLAASCKRLRKVDGLDFDRRMMLAKDELLESLIAEGLVPEVDGPRVAPRGDLCA